MFKECPRYGDNPAKPGGEGWLVNDQQQKVVRFMNDMATAHAEWVTRLQQQLVTTLPLTPKTAAL